MPPPVRHRHIFRQYTLSFTSMTLVLTSLCSISQTTLKRLGWEEWHEWVFFFFFPSPSKLPCVSTATLDRLRQEQQQGNTTFAPRQKSCPRGQEVCQIPCVAYALAFLHAQLSRQKKSLSPGGNLFDLSRNNWATSL